MLVLLPPEEVFLEGHLLLGRGFRVSVAERRGKTCDGLIAILGLGIWVQSSAFRVLRLGFRCSGFRV